MIQSVTHTIIVSVAVLARTSPSGDVFVAACRLLCAIRAGPCSIANRRPYFMDAHTHRSPCHEPQLQASPITCLSRRDRARDAARTTQGRLGLHKDIRHVLVLSHMMAGPISCHRDVTRHGHGLARKPIGYRLPKHTTQVVVILTCSTLTLLLH